jgi:AraC-like DNA-binding protein
LSAMDVERPAADYVQMFQEFLLATLDLSQKQHIGEAFLAAHQKMFFPLIDLAAFFGIGQRQLERRVQTAFGVSLRDVRRITRFGLCLQRIIGHPVGWGDLTRIAQESGYYDQAHMHREFYELAGIAPVQLLQKIAGDDPAYWMYRMRREDFKNLFIPID